MQTPAVTFPFFDNASNIFVMINLNTFPLLQTVSPINILEKVTINCPYKKQKENKKRVYGDFSPRFRLLCFG
jgi:hypothetical protein